MIRNGLPIATLLALLVIASCSKSSDVPVGPPKTEAEALALKAEIERVSEVYAKLGKSFYKRQDDYYELARRGVVDPATLRPVLNDLLHLLDQLDPPAAELMKLNERTGVTAMVDAFRPAITNNAARRREINAILARLASPGGLRPN